MPAKMYRIENGLKPCVAVQLEVGQIIWLNGYGQSPHSHDRLVVYSSYVSDYMQELNYNLVNVDKLTLQTSNAFHIRPESELFGIGHYYTPGDMFEDIESLPAIVEQARENVRILKIKADEEKAKKTEAERIERESLPKMYPYLTPRKDAPKISDHALGAKNIRAELAREFPGVKFSVKSESYSGGSSINVHWTDGPTADEVKFFTDKYQECDFDGMEDLQTYRTAQFPGVFGGAHYVFENRHLSPERIISTALEMGYTITMSEHRQISGVDFETERSILRKVQETSFFVKPEPKTVSLPIFEPVTIRRNEEKNGIEVVFEKKPALEILEALKAEGFRWSRFGGYWWARFSDSRFSFAQSLVKG